MIKNGICCSFFFFITVKLFGQDTALTTLSFQPAAGTTVFKLNEPFTTVVQDDTITIETFRCYISGIELWQKGKLAWKEAESYHLLDAADTTTLQFSLDAPVKLKYDQLKFYLGIDSLTNVGGAKGGDLDPTRGMYWAWQSGYINFKLEGTSPVCPTRHNEFTFHLGGYLPPYNALQTVILDIPESKNLDILMDIAAFLSGIDLRQQNHIMTPGNEAGMLSARAARIFEIGEN